MKKKKQIYTLVNIGCDIYFKIVEFGTDPISWHCYFSPQKYNHILVR